MLCDDRGEFVMTEEFTLLFEPMKDNKAKWMAENSVVVLTP